MEVPLCAALQAPRCRFVIGIFMCKNGKLRMNDLFRPHGIGGSFRIDEEHRSHVATDISR
jgi:hypothetical protein